MKRLQDIEIFLFNKQWHDEISYWNEDGNCDREEHLEVHLWEESYKANEEKLDEFNEGKPVNR